MRRSAVAPALGRLAAVLTLVLGAAACDVPSTPPSPGYPVRLATFQAHRSTDSLYYQAVYAAYACAMGFVGNFDYPDSSSVSVGIRMTALGSCPDTATRALYETLWVIRLRRSGPVRLIVDTGEGTVPFDVPADGALARWPRASDPCPATRVYIAGIPLGGVAYRDSVWLTARAVPCAAMQPVGRVAWGVRDSTIGTIHPVTDSQAVFRGRTAGETFVRANGLDYPWAVEQLIRQAP